MISKRFITASESKQARLQTVARRRIASKITHSCIAQNPVSFFPFQDTKTALISWVFLFFLLGFVPQSKAQFDFTDFPFLEEINHPHAVALGEANMTRFTGGGLIHLNPALQGRRGYARLGSNFTPRFIIVPDFKTQPNREFAPEIFYITPHLGVQSEAWDVSFQLRYFTFGEQVNLEGRRYSGLETIQEIGVSRFLTERLALGASLNFFQSERGLDPAGSVNGVSMHLGAVFQEEFHFAGGYVLYPALGWSLSHFGRAKTYALGAGNSPLPTTMRLGGSLRLDFPHTYQNLQWFSATLHTAFSRLIIGYNTRDLTPYNSFEALLRSWNNYLIRDGEELREVTLQDQIRRHLGLEMTFFEIISLRGGYRHRPDQREWQQRYTVGLGVDLGYIRMDVSHYLGDYHRRYGRTLWMVTVAAPLDWVISSFGQE